MPVIKLQTNREEHNNYCIEIAQECLDRAIKGEYRNLVIAWENNDRRLFDNYAGQTTIELLGLLDVARQGLLIKFMKIEQYED